MVCEVREVRGGVLEKVRYRSREKEGKVCRLNRFRILNLFPLDFLENGQTAVDKTGPVREAGLKTPDVQVLAKMSMSKLTRNCRTTPLPQPRAHTRIIP